MYEKEKELYKKMKEAIDQSTLLLDEKAIEIGKAINEAHRLIGERKGLIEIYERETGLKYENAYAVDVEKLLATKREHEELIGIATPTKQTEDVREEITAADRVSKKQTRNAPDLGTTIWSFALLPMALTEKTLSPSTVGTAVIYMPAGQPENEINLVFHYSGPRTEEEITTLAQETLDNIPDTYTSAINPEGKTIRLKGIRDEETGSLEEFLASVEETKALNKEQARQEEKTEADYKTTPSAGSKIPSVITR